MKKKLLSLFLVMILVMCSTVSAFAAESENVSLVYESFSKVQEALQGESLEELQTAVDGFYDYVDLFNEFSEEELEELAVLLGEEDAESAYWLLLSDWISANIVIQTADMIEAYESNPNAKTASDLVEYLDYCDEETIALFDRYLGDVMAVYETATNDLPTENVQKVYTTFLPVQDAIAFSSYEELVVAVDEFYEVVDIFNELSEEEMEQLALLMGEEDGEAVFSVLLSDWIDANVLVTAGEFYNAYEADPSVENAKALVEYVDSYSEMYEGDLTLLENFYFLINDYYEEAKALLVSDEEIVAEPEQEEEVVVEPEVEEEEVVVEAGQAEEVADSTVVKAPKTGDSSSVMAFAVLFAVSAAVIVSQKKRMA